MITGSKDSFIFCHSNPISGKKLHRIAINAKDINSIQEPENGDGCIIYICGVAIPIKESFDEVLKILGKEWFELKR